MFAISGSLQIDGGCVAQDVKGHTASRNVEKRRKKKHFYPPFMLFSITTILHSGGGYM